MIQKLVSRFQLLMALQRGYDIVQNGDECLVYARGARNDFGTPLVLRGNRGEVEAYIAEVLA